MNREHFRDVLTNPDSTRITRIAALSNKHARTTHRRFLVEGPGAVSEAIAFAPHRIHDVYFTEDAAERHSDLLTAASEADLYIHLCSDQVMRTISTDCQGIVAVVAMEDARELSDILSGATQVLILTETQDPGNAGTMIRVADASGADAVILLKGSVDVTNPKVVRATAGSLFHLPIIGGCTIEEVLRACRNEGLSVLAAHGRGGVDLYDVHDMLTQPVAWLMGNEARGLEPALLSRVDAVVTIPIFGHAESLNVASAATVCLYETARAQR